MNIKAKEAGKLSEVTEVKNSTVVENVNVIKTKEANPENEEFLLTVDYSRSLLEMIKAGNYDLMDEDINEKHFPLPIELSGQIVAVRAKLFHFDHYIGSEKVIFKMDKDFPRFRPATLAEQLAFAEAYPEIQKKFPIIELGSYWRATRASSRVVAIDFDFHGRKLTMSWFEGIWQPFCRFLAICEQT